MLLPCIWLISYFPLINIISGLYIRIQKVLPINIAITYNYHLICFDHLHQRKFHHWGIVSAMDAAYVDIKQYY